LSIALAVAGARKRTPMAPTCVAAYLTRASVLVVDAVRLMSPLVHTWRGLVEEILRFRGASVIAHEPEIDVR
jgi:hypothetical protein